MPVAVFIGVILGGFLGLVTGGIWTMFAVLMGFSKPTGETFLWVVVALIAVGAIGFPIYIKACETAEE